MGGGVMEYGRPGEVIIERPGEVIIERPGEVIVERGIGEAIGVGTIVQPYKTIQAPATTIARPDNLFDQLDRNHDGIISRDEMAAGMGMMEYVAAEEVVHEAQNHIVEIPTKLIYEKVIEVPKVNKVQLKREVLRPEVHQVMKEVVIPTNHVQETIVQVPHVLTHEQIQEVEVRQAVDLVRQIPMERISHREKRVPVPEFNYVQREVVVPAVMTHEKLVEVPVQGEHVECIREVARNE